MFELKTIRYESLVVFFIIKLRRLKGLKKIFIYGIIKLTSTHKYTSGTGGAL